MCAKFDLQVVVFEPICTDGVVLPNTNFVLFAINKYDVLGGKQKFHNKWDKDSQSGGKNYQPPAPA